MGARLSAGRKRDGCGTIMTVGLFACLFLVLTLTKMAAASEGRERCDSIEGCVLPTFVTVPTTVSTPSTTGATTTSAPPSTRASTSTIVSTVDSAPGTLGATTTVSVDSERVTTEVSTSTSAPTPLFVGSHPIDRPLFTFPTTSDVPSLTTLPLTGGKTTLAWFGLIFLLVGAWIVLVVRRPKRV